MLGVIGGSGFYAMDEIEDKQELWVETPFGKSSNPVVLGKYKNREIAFLSRHGSGHKYLPSEINFRANIYALKAVGVRSLVAVSAVGSLRDEIAPGDFSLVGQYIDFTKSRKSSFFGNGIAAHISTANPTCRLLSNELRQAAEAAGEKLHSDKTYICVEGPRLGTQAESHLFRQWGADLVGMTNCPEAFLAKEAQMAYCALAVATDYDCWRSESEFVSVEQVLSQFAQSMERAKRLLTHLFDRSWDESASEFRRVLQTSLMTPPAAMGSEQQQIYEMLRR